MLKISPNLHHFSCNAISKNTLKKQHMLQKCTQDISSKGLIPLQTSSLGLINFCGKKIVGTTQIVNRETGKSVDVAIKREKIGDNTTFELSRGSKRLGFINVKPINYNESPAFDLLPYEKFLNVNHLRTIEGEKYSRIGTQLMKIAIQESLYSGCGGNICLHAEKGYAKGYCNYHSDESPIPFYVKFGLTPVDPTEDKVVKELIDKNLPSLLPNMSQMYLPVSKRDAYIKQLRLEPIF